MQKNSTKSKQIVIVQKINPNCQKFVEKLYILGDLFFRSVQNGFQTAPGLQNWSKLAPRAPKSGLANVPRGPFWDPNPFQNRFQIWKISLLLNLVPCYANLHGVLINETIFADFDKKYRLLPTCQHFQIKHFKLL